MRYRLFGMASLASLLAFLVVTPIAAIEPDPGQRDWAFGSRRVFVAWAGSRAGVEILNDPGGRFPSLTALYLARHSSRGWRSNFLPPSEVAGGYRMAVRTPGSWGPIDFVSCDFRPASPDVAVTSEAYYVDTRSAAILTCILPMAWVIRAVYRRSRRGPPGFEVRVAARPE